MGEKPITDCDGDGCGECDVCNYLDFLEWVRSVGGGGTIERNERIEFHLKAKGIIS